MTIHNRKATTTDVGIAVENLYDKRTKITKTSMGKGKEL